MEDEMNLRKYKKKIIKRSIRNHLIVLIILLVLNITLCLKNIEFIYALMIPNIFCILSVKNLINWHRYNGAVIGKIIDIVLENFDDAPVTVAKIQYEVQGEKYYQEMEISHYGDNNGEEGEEELINQMLERDRKTYLGEQTAVYYSRGNPQSAIVFFYKT